MAASARCFPDSEVDIDRFIEETKNKNTERKQIKTWGCSGLF